MKKTLLLTIMCLFGLFAKLNAQCLPPQNVKAKTELNAPGYDKKYKITCTWDAISDVYGYIIYVSTQYYPDGTYMGSVTTNEFVMGSNVEGQFYVSVRTICDANNEIVSDRSEEVYVILSEDIQLNYDIIVTVNPENAGTVTGDGYYDVNDIVTLTASANAGYKFVSWTENDEVVSTESQYLFTFTTQRELVANFELLTYEVAVSANIENAGTVTGAATYNHGEEVTLTATPNEGYKFISWTENGEVVSTDQDFTFVVTSNRDLVANFKLLTYEVAVTANIENAGTVTGAATYNHGEEVTLTATPNEG